MEGDGDIVGDVTVPGLGPAGVFDGSEDLQRVQTAADGTGRAREDPLDEGATTSVIVRARRA